MSQTRKVIEVEHLSEIFDGVKEDLKSRKSVPQYPTKLRDLDKLIWGIHKKELFVIGARPSMGKTSLAGQLAFNLADANHNVLFISLEMSKEQIVERLFCNVTRINNLDLREGKIDDKVKARMDIFDKLIENLPLCVVDRCGYNFSDIETLIKEMDPKPDIVFLDYIQLISQGRHQNKVSAIEEYFRRLKELSISYNLAMIVLSQIRRMSEGRQNRRPTMDELKGSGSLEEHSDSVALIYWIKRSEFSHEDINEFEINVAKQRHGAIGLVKVDFFPQYFSFSDRNEEYNGD